VRAKQSREIDENALGNPLGIRRIKSKIKNPKDEPSGFVSLSNGLLTFEGEKGRNSCTLDSSCKDSLVCSARTAHSARNNFTAFRDKFLQTIYVFVIDYVKLFLAECAYLFTGRFLKYLFYGCFFFHDI
jgi:hypothetical protein